MVPSSLSFKVTLRTVVSLRILFEFRGEKVHTLRLDARNALKSIFSRCMIVSSICHCSLLCHGPCAEHGSRDRSTLN